MGMLAWLLVAAVLSIVIGMSHFVRSNLGLVSVSGKHWLLIMGICLAGTCWIELVKFVVWTFPRRKVESHRGNWHSAETNSRQNAAMVDDTVPLPRGV